MTPREPTPPLAPLQGLRACCFRFGFLCRVSLAIGPHSLARSSKRTTGHWQSTLIQHLRRCFFRVEDPFVPLSLHRRLISGSFNLPSQGAFQLSITLLLRYRSRYMFSLGGGCPPDSREISDPRYSRSGHVPFVLCTGLSPSLAPRSRGIALAKVGLKGRLTTPHLPAITGGIRFRLCCFHSPLLTASQC